jgi:hypothetical protein
MSARKEIMSYNCDDSLVTKILKLIMPDCLRQWSHANGKDADYLKNLSQCFLKAANMLSMTSPYSVLSWVVFGLCGIYTVYGFTLFSFPFFL